MSQEQNYIDLTNSPELQQSFSGLRRDISRNTDFIDMSYFLSLPLYPLVKVTSGLVHPAFPRTILQFWLLTDTELERMARFYHQAELSEWTAQYPCPVEWRSDLPLKEKRRRFGEFIGLTWLVGEEPHADDVVEAPHADDIMFEQARQARYYAENDDAVKRKLFDYY